jgi:siroheme synthase-like protein
MIIDLAIRGRDVLVVGGGGVASRRVAALLAEGARVTVLAPTLAPSLAALAAEGALRHLADKYVAGAPLPPGDWCLLVVAVDDPVVDHDLVARAQAGGLPVSSALGTGTVRHLAVRRHGPLALALDTGGAAPGLAAALADRLAGELTALVSAGRLAEWQRDGWPRDPHDVAAALGGG